MGNTSEKQTTNIVQRTFQKALLSQQTVALSNLERLRRVHPDKTPQEMLAFVNKWYVGAVAASGAGAGAAAAVPNLVGQGAAAALDFAGFLEASVLYVYTAAELSGVHPEDLESKRLLVSAVLLGQSATGILEKVIGKVAPHWGKHLVGPKVLSRELIKQINKVMGPRFLTIYGTKTGVLVVGKQVPVMIGAVIGGAGNALFATGIIKSAKKIFGPAQDAWPNVEAPKAAAGKKPASTTKQIKPAAGNEKTPS